MKATNRQLAETAFKHQLYDSALWFLDEEQIERMDRQLPQIDTSIPPVAYDAEVNQLLAGYLVAERLGKMRWDDNKKDWVRTLATL